MASSKFVLFALFVVAVSASPREVRSVPGVRHTGVRTTNKQTKECKAMEQCHEKVWKLKPARVNVKRVQRS